MLGDLLVAASYNVPVYDRPDILDVVGTAILIAEVVSMLPDIDTEEGAKTMHYRVASVRLLRDDEFTIFLSREPSPTRAEERRASREEFLLEGFKAAPLGDNGIEELTRRLASLAWAKLSEVEVMIERLACIIEDRSFALADDLLKRSISELRPFDEGVERIHIASEVLAMVEGERLSADSRLERIRGIRELDEFELHCVLYLK